VRVYLRGETTCAGEWKQQQQKEVERTSTFQEVDDKEKRLSERKKLDCGLFLRMNDDKHTHTHTHTCPDAHAKWPDPKWPPEGLAFCKMPSQIVIANSSSRADIFQLAAHKGHVAPPPEGRWGWGGNGGVAAITAESWQPPIAGRRDLLSVGRSGSGGHSPRGQLNK